MGRDKALLEFRGRTLLEHVAEQVAAATGSATIVGPPERYAHLGLPVVADGRPDAGPLAGIEAALLNSPLPRILVVACDMPDVPLQLLRTLMNQEGSCVMPRTEDGRIHPLCAVWSKTLLAAIQASLDAGNYKVLDCLQPTDVKEVSWGSLANANTPWEWQRVAG